MGLGIVILSGGACVGDVPGASAQQRIDEDLAIREEAETVLNLDSIDVEIDLVVVLRRTWLETPARLDDRSEAIRPSSGGRYRG